MAEDREQRFAEFEKFRHWFETTYRKLGFVEHSIYFHTYRESPYYKEWVELGKPIRGSLSEVPPQQKKGGVAEPVNPNLQVPNEERQSVIDFLYSLVYNRAMTEEQADRAIATYDSNIAYEKEQVAQGYEAPPRTSDFEKLIRMSLEPSSYEAKTWTRGHIEQAEQQQLQVQEEYEAKAYSQMYPFLRKQAMPEWERSLPYRTEQQRIQAEAGLFTQRTPEEKPEIPPMPSAEPAWTSAMEELPPALRGYWGSRPGEVLNPIAEARTRWWNTIQQAKRDAEEAEAETERVVGGIKRGAASRAATETDLERLAPFGRAGEYALAARQKFYEQQMGLPQAEEERRGAARSATRLSEAEIPTDPLEAYMKGFPFIEKWLKLAPRQRGDYPSRYAPPAIWR